MSNSPAVPPPPEHPAEQDHPSPGAADVIAVITAAGASFGNAAKSISEVQANTEIERARITSNENVAAMGVEERCYALATKNEHARYMVAMLLIAAIVLCVFIFAGVFLAFGHAQWAAMIVSHAIAVGVGVLGGRGLTTPRPPTLRRDENKKPPTE